MIIDAHAHIFPRMSGELAGGSVRGLTHGRVQVSDDAPFQAFDPGNEKVRSAPETLLAYMDWVGVSHAVLLQNNFYGNHNEAVAEAVTCWPDRFTGAMYLDPWTGDAMVAFHRWRDRLKIVKIATDESFGLFSLYPAASLRDDCCKWLWPEMERRRMTLTLDLGPIGSRSYETDAVAELAANHPDLRIVVCHLAQPRPGMESDKEAVSAWERQIDLARHDNVWLDLSALPHKLPEETFPWPSAGKWIRTALGRVGADRLIWGTDYPGLLTSGTYRQLLDATQSHLQDLSDAEKDNIFCRNAKAAYDTNPTKNKN